MNEHPTRVLVSPSSLPVVLTSIGSGKSLFAADVETTGFNYRSDKITGISIYDPDAKTSYYFPTYHVFTPEIPLSVISSLNEIASRRGVVFHNAKFDIAFMQPHGWTTPATHDTLILAKVADFNLPGGLKQLSALKGWPQTSIEEILPKDKNMSQLPAREVYDYACQDTERTYDHLQWLLPLIENKPQAVIYQLEMAIIPAMMSMEINGVAADLKVFQAIHSACEELVESMTKEAHRTFKSLLKCEAGCKYGCTPQKRICEPVLHSARKMQTLLFDTLKLPTDGLDKTSTGYSTSIKNMVHLRQVHGIEWIDTILAYKEALKARGMSETYSESIESDGRIHTSLLQVHVVSGRIASAHPNLQQVPDSRRGLPSRLAEKSLSFRKGIVAPQGTYLLSCDYSQVEMRVFAALARATKLIQAFSSGTDVHSQTASLMYGIPISAVDSNSRDSAKVLGFGLLYGMSERGLAQRLSITEVQARRLMDSYFSAMPEITRFIADTHRYALNYGGVHTQFGRWIPIGGVQSRNRYEKTKALRLAVNARVQGSAADVMKMAIGKCFKVLPQFPGMKMLMTIHDELLFEVPDYFMPEQVAKVIMDAMRMKFGEVVLESSGSFGPTWGEMKKLFQVAKPSSNGKMTFNIKVPTDNRALNDIEDFLKGVAKNSGQYEIIFQTAQGLTNTGFYINQDGVDMFARISGDGSLLREVTVEEDDEEVPFELEEENE